MLKIHISQDPPPEYPLRSDWSVHTQSILKMTQMCDPVT